MVELDKIEGHTLVVRNVDMLDGTPLLDIKPYSRPAFDPSTVRQGWMDDYNPENQNGIKNA